MARRCFDKEKETDSTFVDEIIDFAIPYAWYDSRIEEKEVEKVVKYHDLARELRKLWKMKTVVIPIVIGTLGIVPKDLNRRLENIGIETKIDELQKSVILNTARILRKVLDVWGDLLSPSFLEYRSSIGNPVCENKIIIIIIIIIIITIIIKKQLYLFHLLTLKEIEMIDNKKFKIL